MPKKKELAPHLRIRLDARLLDRLEKSREKSGRTLTGEISDRLERSFQREDTAELITRAARKTAAGTMTMIGSDPRWSPFTKPEGGDKS